MTLEAEKVGRIDTRDVFYLATPLNNQIEAFRNEGIPAPYLVSVEDVVDMRLDGKFEKANYGTRTSLTPLAVKGENTILYKGSPWMSSPEMAKVAVKAHKAGKFPQLPREYFEFVKETAKAQEGIEPEDRTAIIVSHKGDFKLTPEMLEARFALGKRAKEYFESKGHDEIQFYNLTSDSKDKVDVNYSWFGNSQGGSYLFAWYGNLDGHYGAFGVLRTLAEGNAKNSGYTLTQIGKANSEVIPVVLNKAGLSGLPKELSRTLSTGLLEKLRKDRK